MPSCEITMRHVLSFFFFVMSLLSAPLLILATFVWLIGVVWLAYLGEWGLIGQSIVWWLVSSVSLAIILIPAMGFLWVGFKAKDAVPFIGGLCLLLAFVALVAATAFWNQVLIEWFRARSDEHSLAPAMLVAYGNFMAPLKKFLEEHRRRNPEPDMAPFQFLAGMAMGCIGSIVVVCGSRTTPPNYGPVFLGWAVAGAAAAIGERFQKKALGP